MEGENGKTVKGDWWEEIEVGTTQGGVDSMSLFSALVDDIEQELARAGIRGVQFSLPKKEAEDKGTRQTRNLDFADDLVILLEYEEEVEKALKVVESFYLKRKLIPNPEKCEFIVFDPKKRFVKIRPKLLDRELKQVKEICFA